MNTFTNLAYADAVHDFASALPAFQQFKQILQASLPGLIDEYSTSNNEAELLHLAKRAYPMTRLQGSANELFRQLGGTASTPIAIVCDSVSPSPFIRILNRVTDGQVFFVKNREVYNDPGKVLIHRIYDTEHFKCIYDAFPGKVIYPRYTDDSPKQILHSKFDVEMYIHGENSTCVMKHDGDVIEVENINTTNSIYEITQRLNDVYDFARSAVNPPEAFHTKIVQSCFLRKRAGDWLQALSTFDKRRAYTDARGVPVSLQNAIVYFCSGDQIAVATGLHYNANCISKIRAEFIRIKSAPIFPCRFSALILPANF